MGKSKEIERWRELLEAGEGDGRLVVRSRAHSRPASVVPIPEELHPKVHQALLKRGIEELYSHQAEAIAKAWQQSVIVTTGTASGKSLCFTAPTLDVLNRDSRARALYIYPTKALAQDQARALTGFGAKSIKAAIYDGDTPRESRAQIRRSANVVLTNPDMLHVGILPNHSMWANFFANLAIVVIDEAHVYRGVFGSHVGNVIRRLRRIADAYGTNPRFLLASATIANPHELARRVTGLDDFGVIDNDGSPQAKRTIAMWNPPIIDQRMKTRRSPTAEAADVLAELVRKQVRTIAFMKSRKGVELIAKFAKLALENSGDGHLSELIAPYRAGYTPQQRRMLESQLADGELLGIVATDALELGIDIGDLDAAICVTFPGTVASLRQMWGRAGRRNDGLAVYIAGDDALDQFFCRHPDEFLDRPVEAAILDNENEQIYARHLLCAAHEGPLEPADSEILGEGWLSVAETLETQGLLRRSHPRRGGYDAHGNIFVPRHGELFPAADVSLRSTGLDAFAIIEIESGEMLGSVDGSRAFSTAHEGAIYLHGGRSFEVKQLDIEDRRIFVRPFNGDWYTQPKRDTDTSILGVIEQRIVNDLTISFGKVIVTDQVLAYQRKKFSDHSVLDLIALDLPSSSFATQALWYEIPERLLENDFPLEKLLGSLHAAEHSQIAVLPLLAMCDRWDIGGLSTNLHPQTGLPTIFIYEGHPAGVGIAHQAYLKFETLVNNALRLVSECPCDHGCPSCVQSPKCGNLNEPLSKNGSIELMKRLTAP